MMYNKDVLSVTPRCGTKKKGEKMLTLGRRGVSYSGV